VSADRPDWGTWASDPVALVLLTAVAAAYRVVVARARRRGGRVDRDRWGWFVAGWTLLAVALASPLGALGHWLLSAHMLGHVLIADVAAALMVLGLRDPVLDAGLPAAALGLVRRLLRRPWLAVGLWAAAQWLWSAAPVVHAAHRSAALGAVQHVTLLAAGVALWLVIVEPLRVSAPRTNAARLAMLGASRAATAAVCLPLVWGQTAVHDTFAATAPAFGLTALTDQQLAGAGMCLLELVIFGAAFVAVFLDVLTREERATPAHRAHPDAFRGRPAGLQLASYPAPARRSGPRAVEHAR